ncbi:MAG TPA: response regulator transcription factor [Geobacteraceae bacterium]|nr:response regulator transcription factor [Geobacteraceae bacterium]
MKILVNLGNHLLGKALKELLLRELDKFEVFIPADLKDIDIMHLDFIVADSHTLRKKTSFRQPETKIILIDYGMGEDEISSLLLSYKIDGVLATSTDLPLFKKALQVISKGQIWIDNHKVKALVRHAECAKGVNMDEGLSRKEREIVILISQGLTNREIAFTLCVSEQTVKTHISRIFRKLNVSRRSQLVPLAMKLRVPNAG